MSIPTFNDNALPLARTPNFKLYVDVSENSTETLELQGKGVESWTVTENEEITKIPDVLGNVLKLRGVPKPTQTGVRLYIIKGSVLAGILFNAWYTGDKSKLDSINIVQKFEIVDGQQTGYCLARREKDVMISITDFSGEAEGYLNFVCDFHYSNERVLGEMAKTDANPPVFMTNAEVAAALAAASTQTQGTGTPQ